MNTDELRQYFDKLLAERTEQFETALKALDEKWKVHASGLALALEKFERNNEHQFEKVNMIREQLDGERNLQASKEYVDEAIRGIRADIRKIEDKSGMDKTELQLSLARDRDFIQSSKESAHKELQARIDGLEKFRDNLNGKLTAFAVIIIILQVAINWIFRMGTPK